MALRGFGIDAFAESPSGAALIWRVARPSTRTGTRERCPIDAARAHPRTQRFAWQPTFPYCDPFGQVMLATAATSGRRRRAMMPAMGGWMLICGIGGILLIVLLIVVIANLLTR